MLWNLNLRTFKRYKGTKVNFKTKNRDQINSSESLDKFQIVNVIFLMRVRTRKQTRFHIQIHCRMLRVSNKVSMENLMKIKRKWWKNLKNLKQKLTKPTRLFKFASWLVSRVSSKKPRSTNLTKKSLLLILMIQLEMRVWLPKKYIVVKYLI